LFQLFPQAGGFAAVLTGLVGDKGDGHHRGSERGGGEEISGFHGGVFIWGNTNFKTPYQIQAGVAQGRKGAGLRKSGSNPLSAIWIKYTIFLSVKRFTSPGWLVRCSAILPDKGVREANPRRPR
jgi:hypothetical protein